MVSAKTFRARLPVGITLDAHIQDYLSSVVDAQSFADLLALRDDTEHFLVDAGIDDSALKTFYASLQDQFTSIANTNATGDALSQVSSGLTKIALTEDHDQENGEAEGDSSGSDDKKMGSASPQSKKPFKSKPAKLTKAAKKLAAKSSSTASSPGTPSSAVFNGAGGPQAFMGENAFVEAFSQQSRFYGDHRDAVQGGRPPAGQHQHWRSTLAPGYPPLVQSGTMYGLIGRNGTGKLTILKAIGCGELIGFPLKLRTLYIEQLPSETPDEQTVVETTLLMSESNLLQKAINKYPRQLVKSIKKLEWDRMKVRLAAQLKLATRRSRKRGAEACEELLVVKAEEKAAQAHEMLESVYNKLQQIEAESAEARARELLRGLGFTPANQDLPIKNHLDLPAVIWLQNYLLQNLSDNQTIVVVSHDRNFLNTVSQEIIHGNYDEYEMKLEDKAKMKDRISAALEKKRKHAQDTINKQRSIMNKTGDDKRGAVIASRQKKLERLACYNKTENGHRFKQLYIPGFHFNMGLLVMKEAPEPSVTMPLPTPKELRGHPTTLLSLNNATFAYPGAPASSRPVIQNVSLSLHRSSRIALVATNRCDKSMLMSLLSSEVLPASGSVEKFSSLVRIGCFSQHNVDQLDGEASKLAMKYLMDTFPDEYKSEPMAHGAFALVDVVWRAKGPSGFGDLCQWRTAGVLLLDEITNHLNMATIQGLIVALKEFSGAVVLDSHDAYFVKAACEDDNEYEDNG
ncbi:hypothetical protein BGZ82_001658 [Podila clonocystis]|nr:hypothetical protein BGZ82_001658 [Podila clonocystis]